jgi:hypothetical protein
MISIIEAAILPSLSSEEKKKVVNRISKEIGSRLEKRKGVVRMPDLRDTIVKEK